jgi:hypothetical protein
VPWYPTQAKTGLDPNFLYAAPATAACAAFIEESRTNFINADRLHRKSGAWGTPHSPLMEESSSYCVSRVTACSAFCNSNLRNESSGNSRLELRNISSAFSY